MGVYAPERPELIQDLELVWSAFVDLNATRQVGWGANPIQLRDIAAWLDLYEIEGQEARLDFLQLIRAMDEAMLEWQGKEQDRKDKSDKDEDRKRPTKELGARKRAGRR